MTFLNVRYLLADVNGLPVFSVVSNIHFYVGFINVLRNYRQTVSSMFRFSTTLLILNRTQVFYGDRFR